MRRRAELSTGNRYSWHDSVNTPLVGHYFKPTMEDPTRIRVDDFPTPDELAELQKCTV
jgi:hypothetical protein